MTTITNNAELSAWLEDKPSEWARVLAARIALRALPTISREQGIHPDSNPAHRREFFLWIFCAAAMSWAASGYSARFLRMERSNYREDLSAAEFVNGNLSSFKYADSSELAATSAKIAVKFASCSEPDHHSDGSVGKHSAYEFPRNNSVSVVEGESLEGIWASINVDCEMLAGYNSPQFAAHQLAGEALWLDERGNVVTPEWYSRALHTLERQLAETDDNWHVWTEWYNAIVHGFTGWELNDKHAGELIVRITTQDIDSWNQGSSKINAKIATWLAELREEETELEEPEEEGSNFIEDEPYVFISYSHEDTELLEPLVQLLNEQNIPTWWAKEIYAGESWRDVVTKRLESCTAVLTLWTENSVASKSVIEEAATAQSEFKLVHARLDKAELPFGFGETQYANILSDDLSLQNREIQRLIQALQDKLSPPNKEMASNRVISAGNSEFIVEDGKISATTRPANVSPPQKNNELKPQLLQPTLWHRR